MLQFLQSCMSMDSNFLANFLYLSSLDFNVDSHGIKCCLGRSDLKMDYIIAHRVYLTVAHSVYLVVHGFIFLQEEDSDGGEADEEERHFSQTSLILVWMSVCSSVFGFLCCL